MGQNNPGFSLESPFSLDFNLFQCRFLEDMSAFERFFFVWDLEKGVRVRFLGCPLLRGFFIKEKPISAGTFKLCPLLGGVRFLGCPLLGGLTVLNR